VPIYQLSEGDKPGPFVTRERLPSPPVTRSIAFFALDRAVEGAVPVYQSVKEADGWTLTAGVRSDSAGEKPKPVFYALPGDLENPPATTVPLYEFSTEDGLKRTYSTDREGSMPGYRRSDAVICRVWRNPMTVAVPCTVRIPPALANQPAEPE
jgi:hypothetical protein